MLKSLTLKNFRKHTDLEINFTDGLNVLKGSNEAGKSTISEAVSYALLGSLAGLRESIADVVTYDRPLNSLKVDLCFYLNGVDYRIVRSNTGAELTYGDQIVTGQRETKVFIETLLGCNAKTFTALQMAGQNSVRGILSEGGTAASGLVETLAQLSVIEVLIDKIQNQLPSGNVSAQTALLESLQNSPKPLEFILDAEPVSRSKIAQKAAITALDIARKKAEESNDREAVQELALINDIVVRNQQTVSQIKKLQAGMVIPSAEPTTSESAIAEWKVEQASETLMDAKRKAYATVFPVSITQWNGTRDSFQKSVESLKSDQSVAQQELVDISADRRVKLALKINETECAFCKKDLTDVPEVALRNAESDEAVSALTKQYELVQERILTIIESLAQLKTLAAVDAEIQRLAISTYFSLDTSQVPAKASWLGDPPLAKGVIRDVQGTEALWKAYRASVARYEAAGVQLEALQIEGVPDAAPWQAKRATHAADLQELASVQALSLEAGNAVKVAEAEYASASREKAAQDVRIAERNKTITDTRILIDTMVKHNELIKKLRAARPQIATQLWGTVLGAISHYFSSMRGESSVVERTDAGFIVNGRSVAGLSGSTLDVLGLAIRMALSKVFLPNVPFLFLDESFSACSDEREINGLGTIASSGISQVILVTHSSLGDSLAQNLIAL